MSFLAIEWLQFSIAAVAIAVVWQTTILLSHVRSTFDQFLGYKNCYVTRAASALALIRNTLQEVCETTWSLDVHLDLANRRSRRNVVDSETLGHYYVIYAFLRTARK
uniref:Uncharacterized protein n=1 Tax=Glossina palpalis gambiensis TaxID=67801 RepID=A0A1B0BEN6_9MUSC